mmetsp:Transcript_68983/g.224879  ORF Transcript_68983/g.224879 Transcript_68983/m.224879 type:complete len:229 (-) Transcript_68983:812-1498(-)
MGAEHLRNVGRHEHSGGRPGHRGGLHRPHRHPAELQRPHHDLHLDGCSLPEGCSQRRCSAAPNDRPHQCSTADPGPHLRSRRSGGGRSGEGAEWWRRAGGRGGGPGGGPHGGAPGARAGAAREAEEQRVARQVRAQGAAQRCGTGLLHVWEGSQVKHSERRSERQWHRGENLSVPVQHALDLPRDGWAREAPPADEVWQARRHLPGQVHGLGGAPEGDREDLQQVLTS